MTIISRLQVKKLRDYGCSSMTHKVNYLGQPPTSDTYLVNHLIEMFRMQVFFVQWTATNQSMIFRLMIFNHLLISFLGSVTSTNVYKGGKKVKQKRRMDKPPPPPPSKKGHIPPPPPLPGEQICYTLKHTHTLHFPETNTFNSIRV